MENITMKNTKTKSRAEIEMNYRNGLMIYILNFWNRRKNGKKFLTFLMKGLNTFEVKQKLKMVLKISKKSFKVWK
jgi:hypothetical protein